MSYQCAVCLKGFGSGESPLRLVTKWKECLPTGESLTEKDGILYLRGEPISGDQRTVKQIAQEKNFCGGCAIKHQPENPIVQKYCEAQTRVRIARLNQEQADKALLRDKQHKKDMELKREAELAEYQAKKAQEASQAQAS